MKEVKSKVVKAYLGIYVDDIMVVGEHGVLTQVMQDLQRVFYMSAYEEVTEEHGASKSRRRMRRTRCIKRSMWVSCYNDVRFKVERIIRFLRL